MAGVSEEGQFDVIVLGGGLAGLTCALQCRRQCPDARILVLEKRPHPAPEATHKVGESTVEVGSHYFAKVLGLEPHLASCHLPKMGLRLFFRSGDNTRIEERLELGGSDFPASPSFQLDRGRLENHLAEHCQSLGIVFQAATTVTAVDVARGRACHQVTFEREGRTRFAKGRWIVDASGRAALLKRKLNLKEDSTHAGNAVWFRIGTRIKVDDWSGDAAWQHPFRPDHPRWLSTNHLMGVGYWVWLIPLASGSTSIGIVAQEELHPLNSLNSMEKALAWLEQYEPLCAAQIRGHLDQVQDFLAIKRYPQECRQLFSSERWGIIGDAGVFLDPFYSPGSDYIALANTYLCELIRRDLTGRSIVVHAPAFNYLFKRFIQGGTLIFRDQYPIFGNHQVMPVKIAWDWMIYWTVISHIFIHGRTCRLSMFSRNLSRLNRIHQMNQFLQAHFRRWHQASPSMEASGRIDTCRVPLLAETNRGLLDELDDSAFDARFKQHAAQLETLFWEIIDHSGVPAHPPFRRRSFANVKKGAFQTVFDVSSGRYPTPQQCAETCMASA
jgi:flavin-dependent dehydrogenase